MIFIGGLNNRIREVGPGEFKSCSHCNKEQYQLIQESHDSLNLFFIPLFPFNRKLFSVCPACQVQSEIASENFNYYRDLATLNLMYLNDLIEEREYFLRKQTLKKPQP